jgi:ABC-type branched-subunit amino acid transport system ATPase component/branched-subunit amino acid ABC-type transport system permease component
MDQHLSFLLLGLANGAVYAALALALTVTFRSSGVVNFATGALSLQGAYTYASLRQGKLLVIVPGLPGSVDLGFTPGFWPAMILTLMYSAVFGLVLYLVVFRPLRAAPAVARAVASVGVLVVMTALMVKRLGSEPVNVKTIFPRSQWTLGSIRLSSDRVWFAVTIVALALVLSALFRFTRFGLATRAAAETEKGALVSGLEPDSLAAVNWMLSASVAALAGVLIAPIVPLVPTAYTLFIVPALAAAVLGGFQYLLPAVLGGLLIGMTQSEVTYLKATYSWLPQSGLSEVVPLVLILVVLVVRAKPLPSRGTLIRSSMGRAPRPSNLVVPTVVAGSAGALMLIFTHGSWRSALVTSFILAIVSLSLVVVTGYAGQVSLAQLTLAGVAGFSLSTITTDWRVPFPLAPLMAAAVASVVGVVIGLPALRIRGLSVSVVTLALAVAIEALWFRNVDFVPSAGKVVSGPELLGINLRARHGSQFPTLSFSLLVLGVLMVVAVGVAWLRTSRLGSSMLAVRANERSAAASGIDVVRIKLVAFAIGAFIAGIGGSLLAYKIEDVTFDSFAVLIGLSMFATAYLAGITSVSGGVVAGIAGTGGLVYLATTKWISLGSWYDTLLGVGLVITIIKNPEGIVGPAHSMLARRRNKNRQHEAVLPARAVDSAHETSALAGTGGSLTLQAVRVVYGGVVAVDDVTLTVPTGTMVGLIGPNGAGKTTLLDAISGLAPSGGAVALDGVNLQTLPPFRRARAGLGRTFQAIDLYDDLSVRENVLVGLSSTDADKSVSDGLVRDALALLELSELAERPAGELSQGRRQLVSIARALVGRPRVLLLDEPAGGLDTTESAWLGQRLQSIRDSGVTIFVIDHDMSLMLRICDEVHVLNFGQLIATGTPADVQRDPAVVAAYLGNTHGINVAVT